MIAETICKEKARALKEKIALHLSKAKCYGVDEGYSVDRAAGVVRVRARHRLGLDYGACQVVTAAVGGHLAELVGEVQPRFPLRPLWVTDQTPVALEEGVWTWFPKSIGPESIKEEGQVVKAVGNLVRRYVEWGYNTLVLGLKPDEEGAKLFEGCAWDLAPRVLREVRAQGLKLMVRPHEVEAPQGLHKWLPHLKHSDLVFWMSRACGEQWSQGENNLLFDEVVEEMQACERALEKRAKLVFYVPSPAWEAAEGQALWLPKLCDEAGAGTHVAFSPVVGQPLAGFGEPHPIWEALRQSPDTSATPLLPLLNAGQLGRGEGLWPILPLEEFQRFFARLYRHPFAGALAFTGAIPSRKGFLDANLWLVGQLLWHHLDAELLAETWFKVHREDLPFVKARPVLQTAGRLVEECHALHQGVEGGAEKVRQRVECLLAQVQSLHALFVEGEGAGQGFESLRDYLLFFIRDVKKWLVRLLKQHQVPMGSVLTGDDLQDSFWVAMDAEPNKRIGSAATATLLSQPHSGTEGSVMRRIFEENRTS